MLPLCFVVLRTNFDLPPKRRLGKASAWVKFRILQNFLQGEEQQKLDILANQIFISFLRNSYTTCFIGKTIIKVVLKLCSDEEENATENAGPIKLSTAPT